MKKPSKEQMEALENEVNRPGTFTKKFMKYKIDDLVKSERSGNIFKITGTLTRGGILFYTTDDKYGYVIGEYETNDYPVIEP